MTIKFVHFESKNTKNKHAYNVVRNLRNIIFSVTVGIVGVPKIGI